MPRRRLGVALLLPAPAVAAINGLRRSVGTDVGRIDPHITLVPPVNVRTDDLPDALHVLRSAAEHTPPLSLVIGPAASFEPVNPVLYLAVSGDRPSLDALRDRVFAAPLSRPLSHPFHPHVTLGEGLPPERTVAAVSAMANFDAAVTVDRVHLLEEHRTEDGRRVWRPLADAAFAEPSVVGRGGLPLDLRVSGAPDPDAVALLNGEPGGSEAPVTVTGWRDRELVGVAAGSIGSARARLRSIVVAEGHRRQGVGRHLLASFLEAAGSQGAASVVAEVQEGSAGSQLCRSVGFVERSRLDEAPGAALVVLERRLV